MNRLLTLAGALALALAVLVSGLRADDKKDKPKDIGEIMQKAHKGDTAYKAAIGKAIKDKKLDDAKDTMKAWVAIGSHLGTFDPPKGDKDSWKKLTEKYGEDLKALEKAINDKDDKAAQKALNTVNASCKGCHGKHKG